MKKCLSALLALLLLLTAIPVSAAGETDEKLYSVTISVTENYDEVAAEIEILNQRRVENGLPPLTLDPTLTAYAMRRAAECTIYYSHARPDGSRCFSILEDKWSRGGAGENVAIGYWNAADVMSGWMESSGHRTNILNGRFVSVGLGCVESANGEKSWVQLFSTIAGDVHVPSGKVSREALPLSIREDLLQLKWNIPTKDTWLIGETATYEVWAVNQGFTYSSTRLSGGYTVLSSSDCVEVDADAGSFTTVGAGRADLTLVVGSDAAQVVDTVTVNVRQSASLTARWEADGALTVSWDGAQPGDRLIYRANSHPVRYGEHLIGEDRSVTIRDLQLNLQYDVALYSSDSLCVSNVWEINTNPQEHRFDDDTDTVCNDCGFVRCTPLLHFSLADGYAVIDGCTDDTIRQVEIPAAIMGRPVTTIRDYAFTTCHAMRSITIPESVTTIGYGAFHTTDCLTDVYYYGTEADRDAMVIGGDNGGLLSATWHHSCRHVYDDDFDADCNLCGAVREVTAVRYGDVNDDGKVNNRDMGLLQQYLNGKAVTVNLSACDVNGDGKVNNRDMGLLQRYLNGWNVTLG